MAPPRAAGNPGESPEPQGCPRMPSAVPESQDFRTYPGVPWVQGPTGAPVRPQSLGAAETPGAPGTLRSSSDTRAALSPGASRRPQSPEAAEAPKVL